MVLLKVHLEAPVQGDLARSLQALAMEVMEAGYHFYILLHVSQGQCCQARLSCSKGNAHQDRKDRQCLLWGDGG